MLRARHAGARWQTARRFGGACLAAIAALFVAGSTPGLERDPIGVRASFDDIRWRERLRATGRLIQIGENRNVIGPLVSRTSAAASSGAANGDDLLADDAFLTQSSSGDLTVPASALVRSGRSGRGAGPELSPDLETVFEIHGPGYEPGTPEYYLADGVYPVYDPPSFEDPTLHVRAVPREAFETASLASARRHLWLDRQRSALSSTSERAPGQGLQISVPITMPGPLKEVFGRGATNIKVTGRENLSFAGESRRSSNFIPGEQGRGQSLFPRLDMKQELQVKLDGTIGDKVHVQVDHNSSGIGSDANRINIFYQGYDDDIVQRVDLGGTNLALPGASLVSFSGGHRGLFGIKTEMRVGDVLMRFVASKQEAQLETRSLVPSGGTPRPISLRDDGYLRDRFFFYEKPDSNYSPFTFRTYGIPPDLLLDRSQVLNLRVFVDTQDPGTLRERKFEGYAVADLESGITPDEMEARYLSASNTQRYPEAGTRDGHWRELTTEEIGFVYHARGTTELVLGFFLRNGAAGNAHAIGIAINDPARPVGQVREATGEVPSVRLRLIRHPTQDANFGTHPSAFYMMRHVYTLLSQDISSIDLRIFRNDNSTTPDVPRNLSQSTYLHMFGLDDLNESGQPIPDGKVDVNAANLLDLVEGFLYMPGTRPFSPTPERVTEQLLKIPGIDSTLATNDPNSLFGPGEVVSASLYTLPPGDPATPHTYRLEGVGTGTDSEILLPPEVIEGSEVVRIGTRTLVAGTDYVVQNGRIELRGEAANSLSQIEISYQVLPLFGGGKSTLLGGSAEYELGTRGRLATVLLYESTGSATQRVKLGEEPSRSFVGDLNGALRFDPKWMTRLVNILPFTTAAAPSQLNMSAEVATSVPNPNTQNVAYVDDLEGADASDEQSMSRTAWSYASIPIDATGTFGALADSSLRVPIAYYNPSGEVKAGNLNPTLGENEADDGLNVLELGFDQDQVDALLIRADRDAMWSGIMRSFGTTGIDLTQTKSIEFWINDYVGIPQERHGRMHIDFGDISEDFILFPNSQDGSRFNREAPTFAEFNAQEDDLGWNLRNDECPTDNFPTTCGEAELRFPFGSECYIPGARNCDENGRLDQHYLANGSEKNNSYDTEDLDNDGRFDNFNSYFGITLDLADTTVVVTDVNPLYGSDPNIPADLKAGFYGWRKVRIDLERIAQQVLKDPGASSPNLRRIPYLRLWFEDPGTPSALSLFKSEIQLYGLRLTENQWTDVGVFAVDSTEVMAQPGETFSIGVINNKDDPQYNLPPDAIEVDEQGTQAREQALRVNWENLQPGHEVVAERTLAGLGRGLDFTQYQKMNYFVKAAPGTFDPVEVFFRAGTDTLNYYEIAHIAQPGEDWLEVRVDLTQLTDLKFPENVPGATFQIIRHGAVLTPQVQAQTVNTGVPVPLLVTMRGNPSFTSITRFQVGVRNRLVDSGHAGFPRTSPRFPGFSGEIWFNNVRLEEPERTRGIAQAYQANAKLSDVFDISGSYSARNADFRGLQQRSGSNFDSQRLQGNVRSEVSRLVPTLGFVVPVDFGYSRDRALPKFSTNSDTRLDAEAKQEQRTEAVNFGYGFSISKRPSRFWLNKVTLDRLSYNYRRSRDQRRSFTTRDTSQSRSQSLKYDLAPRERTLGFGKRWRVNWMPTNLSASANEQTSSAARYNVLRPRVGAVVYDSLVLQPSSPARSLSLNAATSLRPLPILNARYSFNETRDYRVVNPANEVERLTVLGYDFGIPLGRSEQLAVDLTPRRFRLGYSTSFGDQRTFQRLPSGEPLPDVHTASLNRGARIQFDFGLHRRIMGWLLPDKGPRVVVPPGEPRGDEEPPPPPVEEPPGGGGGAGGAPFEPHEDGSSRFAAFQDSVPPAPPAEPEPQVPPPAPEPSPDEEPSVPPAPPGETVPPVVPAPGTPPQTTGVPAGVDSVAAPKRGVPNPLTPIVAVLRKVGDIDPIKVEYSNNRTASYTGLPDTPTGPFRYGFSLASGFPGQRFSVPGREDLRQALDLQSAIPLRSVRLGVKYKLETGLGTFRNWDPQRVDVLIGTNQDHTTSVSFPSLDLAINNIEKAKFLGKKPFGNALERSTITLGYTRILTERFNTTQVPNGPVVEGSSKSETTSGNFTANWSGQWKRGVSTSLNLSQSSNSQETLGPIKYETVTRGLTGTVRFKIAPKGGLRLPFLGSRGTLRSGIDVSLNGSFNKDLRRSFNNPSNPEQFNVDGELSTIQIGARGDYSLTRSMTGGVDLGFSRSSDAKNNNTVSAVRLGFNVALIF